jgi:hypothetical protein
MLGYKALKLSLAYRAVLNAIAKPPAAHIPRDNVEGFGGCSANGGSFHSQGGRLCLPFYSTVPLAKVATLSQSILDLFWWGFWGFVCNSSQNPGIPVGGFVCHSLQNPGIPVGRVVFMLTAAFAAD